MSQSFEPLKVPFSTADADWMSLAFDHGRIVVRFVDWRDQEVQVEFHDVIAYLWEEGDAGSSVEHRDDLCYTVNESEWLNRHVAVGSISSAENYQHYKLCFNARGVLQVLASSLMAPSSLLEQLADTGSEPSINRTTNGAETTMAYGDFTIAELKRRFQLTIDEADNLFAHVAEVDLPASLLDTLARYLPLALNLSTEKARSELVIAPVLVEFKLLHRDQVSVFSGVEFSVDEANGLKGQCDYILSRSPEQLALTAPICVLVEAKNENIVAGIPQCLAEMVAARLFNEKAGTPLGVMYGIVTTGTLWRFLKLEGTRAHVDSVEYPIQSPRKIFGILTQIALG